MSMHAECNPGLHDQQSSLEQAQSVQIAVLESSKQQSALSWLSRRVLIDQAVLLGTICNVVPEPNPC